VNDAEIKALRERFGVDRAAFARMLGVDTRTVFRWESGESEASGSALAILVAFREALKTDDANAIVEFVKDAVAIGGLSYLLLKLLKGES
jgi:transcriptional regulator with XRE-family HTH domain